MKLTGGLSLIALVMGAQSRISTQPQPRVFAGWIVSAKGELWYREATASEYRRLEGKPKLYHRLYMGAKIKAGQGGEATLLIYGQDKHLGPNSTLTISPPPRNAGKSILDRFTRIAGGQRAGDVLERAWRV